MESADEGYEDGFDDGRGTLALPAPEDASAAPSPWRRRAGIVAGVLVAAAAAGGFLAWRATSAPRMVALAGIDPAAARERLAAEAIACEVRDGAAWVAPGDVRRAVAACGRPARPGNPVADALSEESIFASGESVRARRTAATLRMLESAIAMQPGVDRASVVVGEPARTAGPGGQAGGVASVTVSMRSGRMSQDLVDAVAMLVSGACPGVRPESVVIVDAAEGRVRVARDAGARSQADAVRARESAAESVIASLLADLPVADVRVRESDHGAVFATVEFAQADAAGLAAAAGAPSVAEWVASERERMHGRVAPFVGGDDGCAFALQVVVAPAPGAVASRAAPARDAIESPRPEASAGTHVPSPAVDERSMPLGPSGDVRAFPVAWLAVLVGGAAALGFGWWLRHRRAGSEAAGPDWAEADESLPGGFDAGDGHAELSAEVSRAVPAAAGLLAHWIAGGRAIDAAHVVVALEAGAASAVLQSLSVAHVQSVTAALSSLESPAASEIAAAAGRFAAEFQLSLRVHGGPAQEAA